MPERGFDPRLIASAGNPWTGRERWKSYFHLVSRVHLLALVDQAVVSATSFLTTVLIARWTSAAELGIYAIGLSVIASILAVQDSLILLPYSIQRHHPIGTPSEYARASLTLSGLLSVASTGLLVVGALIFVASDSGHEMSTLMWALAAVVPFVLSREFGRRFAFAHLHIGRAVTLDIAVAAIQLVALGWLGWTGRLSNATAFGALGAACGLTTVGWWFFTRNSFVGRRADVFATMKQSWALAKWLLVGRITVQVQGYIAYWLSIVVAGAAVTGVYAACMSIVSFANPIIFGIGNVLTPRSVLAWKEGGGPRLRNQAVQDALLIGAVMAVFAVTVAVAGDAMMHSLYRGKDFDGQSQTLTVLALAMLATAVGMPASNALASMERPRAIVAVGLLGVAVTVALVWWLMSGWGLLGAAYGYLSGSIVGAIGRWAAFLMLVSPAGDPRAGASALKQFLSMSDDSAWTATRLGEGDHAAAYSFQKQNGNPIWEDFPSLVVKVFKPQAKLTIGMAKAQLDSLSKLNLMVSDRIFNGWRLVVPRPLYLCDSPLALIMTNVPGRDIDSPASAGGVQAGDVSNAAYAFIAGMEQGWDRGERHGDLGLRNVHFDFDRKLISIIDPGTLESCRVCNDHSRGAKSVALDLGHLLFEMGTDVADILGSPRERRQVFVDSALQALIERLGSSEERRWLLNEIWTCAAAHLEDALPSSWSLRGIWHRFVRQTATHRIRSLLDRLEGYPLEHKTTTPRDMAA